MHYVLKIKAYVASLLLICWVALLTNNVLYMHKHQLADGRIIWHAHPYKEATNRLTHEQTSFPNHEHTDLELIFLDALANPILFFLPTVFFLFFRKIYPKFSFLIFEQNFHCKPFSALRACRAPPYFSHFL